MNFESIVGNQSAVRSLQNALIEDRLPGSYLFVGPQGVGKTALAIAFAKALACFSPRTDPFDSCGECESCRRTEAGTQTEIVNIAPAGDQTQIWQFWDRDGKPPGALQRAIRYAPVMGRKRVFIIERAGTLNEPTANSLLKVLEEPPSFVHFVLLSPHTARMLPTVLSRCQVVRLAPVAVDTLVTHLEMSERIEPARARFFAWYAEGRVGAALDMARNKEVEAEIDRIFEIAQRLTTAEPLAAPKLAEELRKAGAGIKVLTGGTASATTASDDEPYDAGSREKLGRGQLGALIDLLVTFYRDLLSLRLGGPAAPVALEQRRGALTDIAAASPPYRWQCSLEALLQARRNVDQNVNTRLLIDWLAIKLVAGGTTALT